MKKNHRTFDATKNQTHSTIEFLTALKNVKKTTRVAVRSLQFFFAHKDITFHHINSTKTKPKKLIDKLF